MSLLAAATRLQVGLIAANRDYLLEVVRAPLLAVLFLVLVRHGGREDLLANAVLAPILVAMWGMALMVSGEIVDADRWLGVLEPTVATPVSFARLVVNRVLAATAVSLVVVVEVWLVAVAFAATPTVHHPLVLLAAATMTLAATAGTGLLMAALFVATRTAHTFQNSLSYPILLLGGVFVPVAALPGWLHPPARLLFLSWSSDLLRDSLRPQPVGWVVGRLAVVLVLGAASALLGWLTLGRALRLVRGTGSLGLR